MKLIMRSYMKFLIIFLMIICGTLNASEKDQNAKIAKAYQCNFIRSNSFADVYEKYTGEKTEDNLIKKVSNEIISQGFKICDPEISASIEKDIYSVCTGNCDKKPEKGILDFGGPSTGEIDKCKRICRAYSDLVSAHYAAASGAINKYIEVTPNCTKKVEAIIAPPTQISTPTNVEPSAELSEKTAPIIKTEKQETPQDVMQEASKMINEGESSKKLEAPSESRVTPEPKVVPKVEKVIRPESPKEQIPVELLE